MHAHTQVYIDTHTLTYIQPLEHRHQHRHAHTYTQYII